MVKKGMSVVGVIGILVCVLFTNGWAAFWNFFKQILLATFAILKWLMMIALRFPDSLGITDWLWTRGIFGTIAIIFGGYSAFIFTRKEKKKLLGIISTIVSVISALLTFA